MKKIIIALITLAFTSTSSIAGPKIEVLHWWTSGGEAAALKVLKDDFAANGGEWLDMPVAGGGGDAANVALKARIVAEILLQLLKSKVLQSKNTIKRA